jgi:hypothetical protein
METAINTKWYHVYGMPPMDTCPKSVEGLLTSIGVVPQMSLMRSSRISRMAKVSNSWMASACPYTRRRNRRSISGPTMSPIIRAPASSMT